MTDDLLTALREALNRQPDSLSLRLHLAQMLLQGGAGAEALEHATMILKDRPASLEALEVAAGAARVLGDDQRAAEYERLFRALKPATAATEGGGDQDQPAMASVSGDEGVTDAPWWELAMPGITMRDVGGLQAVKERITTSFLGPLHNPALREAFGVTMRGGLLLYGPPGCGKTFVARATAGELGARFLSVGLSDVLDMWVGASERNLHAAFEMARRGAPCVLFFDEIDALGQRRSHLRMQAALRGVVNQLLTEMDGVEGNNDGVFILAASNSPWDIDSALLRPGRLDRMILVEPPDVEARTAILRYHFRDLPTKDLDLTRLARACEGYSGADLALVCRTAAERAMQESTRAARVIPIGNPEAEAARKEVRPSVRGWFEEARNVIMFGNDSGTYDDLARYMREHKLL